MSPPDKESSSTHSKSTLEQHESSKPLITSPLARHVAHSLFHPASGAASPTSSIQQGSGSGTPRHHSGPLALRRVALSLSPNEAKDFDVDDTDGTAEETDHQESMNDLIVSSEADVLTTTEQYERLGRSMSLAGNSDLERQRSHSSPQSRSLSPQPRSFQTAHHNIWCSHLPSQSHHDPSRPAAIVPIGATAMRNTKIFAGSSHPQLASLIVTRLGAHLAKLSMSHHQNREISATLAVSVRNQDVYIVQSAGAAPVNDHLMELLILARACQSASAKRITAIVPFFPYSKQCKKKKGRSPLTAKLVANMLQVAGIDHLICMDLHASQISNFFDLPVDNLLSEPTFVKYLREYAVMHANWLVQQSATSQAISSPVFPGNHVHQNSNQTPSVAIAAAALLAATTTASSTSCLFQSSPSPQNTNASAGWGHLPFVIVAKNAGGVKRVTALADRLNVDFALIHRDAVTRKALFAEGSQSLDGLTLVGEVINKIAVLLDDIIDFPRNYIDTARLLLQAGAQKVLILAPHGVFSGTCLEELQACESIERVVITNTLPLPENALMRCPKISVLDISSTLAEAIRRTHNGESISYLFHTVA